MSETAHLLMLSSLVLYVSRSLTCRTKTLDPAHVGIRYALYLDRCYIACEYQEHTDEQLYRCANSVTTILKPI